MAAPDQDKRKGKPRIARRLPVRFGTDAKMCGGMATDISEGGLKVECTESFSANSVITVFVQFPRHSVRLRVRVIWCSSASQGGSATMGLALTQPEPQLKRAYGEWLAEVKLAVAETQVSGAVSAAASAATAVAARPEPAARPEVAPAPKAPEPRGPIHRRLGSRQGQSYDALLERTAGGWNLTIVQLPRQLGVGKPDFQELCPDYATAEKTLREFVRTH